MKYERKTKDIDRLGVSFKVPLKDWGKLINSLRREGYTKASISRVLGISRNYLDVILANKVDPPYSIGETIIKLQETLSHEKGI